MEPKTLTGQLVVVVQRVVEEPSWPCQPAETGRRAMDPCHLLPWSAWHPDHWHPLIEVVPMMSLVPRVASVQEEPKRSGLVRFAGHVQSWLVA